MIINNLPAGGGRRSLIVDGVEFRKEHGATYCPEDKDKAQ